MVGKMVAAKVVSVAVGQDLSSKGAVKWAVRNLLSENDVLTLLHVRPPVRSIPTPMGGYVPIAQLNDEKVAAYLRDVQGKIDELFCAYKNLCCNHKVKVDCVVVRSDSIPKGLLDYIVRTGTQKLVLGSSVHNILTRKFMGPGIAAYISKHAPSFCSVLVISKQRLLSVKDVNYSMYTPRSASGSSDSETFDDIVTTGPHQGKSEMNKKSQPTLQLTNRSPYGLDVFSQPFLLQNSKTAAVQKWMDLYENEMFISPFWTSEAHDEACYNKQRQSFESILNKSGQLLESNEEDVGQLVTNLTAQCTSKSDHLSAEDTIPVGGISSTTENVWPLIHNIQYVKNEEKYPLQEAANLDRDCSTGVECLFNSELENKLSLNPYEQEVEKLNHQVKEAICLAEKARKDADVQAILRIEAENAALTAAKKARDYATKQFEEADKRQEVIMAVKLAREVAAREAENADKVLKAVEIAKQTAKLEVKRRKVAEAKSIEEAEARKAVTEALQLVKQKYRVYDYDELRAATENFSDHLKLGEGGYGSVYKGKLHHMTVAIKVLTEGGYQGPREFQREVELLNHIHHPHIVLLLGCCPEKGCLVYEYTANGSLEDRLACKGDTAPLPWFTRFRIIAEVANAIHFLHSSRPDPIIHRDLKPGNILLDSNQVSKLSDVGLAGLVPERFADANSTYFRDTTPVGTFAYMDPEYQRTGLFGPKSDVYALGIVMLQVLTGKPPVGVHEIVEEALDSGKLNKVLDHSAGEWPHTETMEVAGLALQCAEMKRKHRPDLETCVLPILDSVRAYAGTFATKEACMRPVSEENCEIVVPERFLCPIFQVLILLQFLAFLTVGLRSKICMIHFKNFL
ncbi:hypothetical protein O6H91_18G021700 [Diphasiastrum complanatum]|uniref:Uncharacterized protein n=2 Tax=Diphasiastrum complanatum TaxID=34168 RepID=A0ACC2AYS3_DIPCM|nr:hypothetical protein O6H91_18G021700 [Diphasiastrum complanatum]KAJ7522669.1 hypothetical protein O6H91_18G021700 [Diphasiastrum complanatum]